MDNQVKNAVLAYRIDNSDGCGSYVELSNVKLPAAEFAFDIWYKAGGLCSNILSQPNGFSVGISSDAVIVRLPSGQRLSIKSDITKLPNGVWTNLYLGYGQNEIQVYVNGYLFGSAACPETLKNGDVFEVGTEFTGFVRSLRFYAKTIAEDKFKDYFMAVAFDAAKMADTAAFMDFTNESIPDLSGLGVKAAVNGNCALADTVEVYCPAKGSFAHFADSTPFNIGGFKSGEFSLYAKIYIRPFEHQRHIVALNGTVGSGSSAAVLVDCTDGGVSFIVAIAGVEHTFNSDVQTYDWVDLIVCVKGTELTVYINGTKQTAALAQEFRRTEPGDFKIGGCSGVADLTCEHYIHTVAVFDTVLSEQDAVDFLANHPFVFEDNLTALVDFSAGSADELVHETEVYIDSDDLITVVNTVDVLPTEPYQPRINYSATASKLKSWEAETVAEGVKSFVVDVFGLSCAATAAETAALAAFLANRPQVLDGAAGLYAERVITSQGYAKALASMSSAASKVCLRGLALNVAGSGSVGSAAAAAAGSALYAKMQEMQFAVLAGMGALAALAAIAAETVEKARKPKPDDDDKDAKVTLVSLAMQIAPDDYTTSAVRCQNYKGVISGDEWTKEEKCQNPAVYIADRLKKARIRLKFQLTGNLDAKTTHTVSLSASVCGGSNMIFDNFHWKQAGLAVGQEYEAELESGIACSVAKDFAHEHIELWWSADVDGKAVVLPNTVLEVYVVPTVPCQPISLEKEFPQNYICVEYLNIFSEGKTAVAANEADNEAVGPDGVVSIVQLYQRANAVYFHRRFRYEGGQSKYINWQYHRSPSGMVAFTEIHFNEREFRNDLNSGDLNVIPIQCDVYATLLHYSFNLIGVRCRYAYVVNPVYNAQGERAPLAFHQVVPAGSPVPQDRYFTYHMIIEVGPQPNVTGMNAVVVFDASMGKINNAGVLSSLSNVPFYGANSMFVNTILEPFTYRGLAIQNATAAIIDASSIVFWSE